MHNLALFDYVNHSYFKRSILQYSEVFSKLLWSKAANKLKYFNQLHYMSSIFSFFCSFCSPCATVDRRCLSLYVLYCHFNAEIFTSNR